MRSMFLLGPSVLIVGLVIVIAIGIDSLESPLDGWNMGSDVLWGTREA
jgi:hypothetical protein